MTYCQNCGDMGRLIQRLQEALEIQQNTEGTHCATPTVEYCLTCDEITVDDLSPKECLEHPTVMSDGHEHGGIQATLTVLKYFRDSDHNP